VRAKKQSLNHGVVECWCIPWLRHELQARALDLGAGPECNLLDRKVPAAAEPAVSRTILYVTRAVRMNLYLRINLEALLLPYPSLTTKIKFVGSAENADHWNIPQVLMVSNRVDLS
jgi:hypothetical protein